MKRKHIIRLLLALSLLLCLAAPTYAETTIESDEEYVFTGEEFADSDDLCGVFFTELPAPGTASLLLGDRTLRAGDAVTAEDLPHLRLRPDCDRSVEASITFLPIYKDGAAPETVLPMHIQKKQNLPPVVKDVSFETWRNLPNTGALTAENDDGPVTFTLKNRPTRGTVELAPDGTFTYTPKRNKVGEDSFTFIATDTAGGESIPATVHIRILHPQDAETFADLSRDAQFSAMWMRECGLFSGERVSGTLNFGPEKPVSRGEFLAMVMDLNGIAPEIGLPTTGFADEQEAASWQRPYLASALRRGIIRGCRREGELVFRPNDPITGAEAALILTRALGLDPEQAVSTLKMADESVPAWASDAVLTLRAVGVSAIGSCDALSRAEVADLLYACSKLS